MRAFTKKAIVSAGMLLAIILSFLADKLVALKQIAYSFGWLRYLLIISIAVAALSTIIAIKEKKHSYALLIWLSVIASGIITAIIKAIATKGNPLEPGSYAFPPAGLAVLVAIACISRAFSKSYSALLYAFSAIAAICLVASMQSYISGAAVAIATGCFCSELVLYIKKHYKGIFS